jgi:hypothetical protein
MDWPLPPPPDPALPRARDLLVPEPSEAALERFLAARKWTLELARPAQAIYWPGSSCTVRYRVRATDPAGRSRWLILCAESRRRPRPAINPPPDFPERFVIEAPVEDQGDVRIWVFPYDPRLPGLPGAAHAPSVRAASRLDRPAAISLLPVRYRPGSRAVFRYAVFGPEGRRAVFYGKVLREEAFARTFQAHRSLSGSRFRLAAPRAADGISGLALFPALRGTSLRDRLIRGEPLPSPRRLAKQVERIGSLPWRGSTVDRRGERRIRSCGRLLAHLLPHRGDEVAHLVEELAEKTASPVPGPTVHGDLYDAQVLVDDRFSLGLVDLEEAGPGDALLDWANFSAHLAGLGASVPAAGRRPLAYRALLRREVLERTGAGETDLTWREAACTFLLAPGPFRIRSEDWPQRVERRLDGALRLAGRAAA